MANNYMVIDTHVDEYSKEECTVTLTVGELIRHLQGFDTDMKIVIGNNIQSDRYNGHDWWWTYGNITVNDIRVIPEDKDEDEDDDDGYPMKISLDNGHSFLSVPEVMAKVNDPECPITWETIERRMTKDGREATHREYAPCSEEEFLTHYLEEFAPWNLIIG